MIVSRYPCRSTLLRHSDEKPVTVNPLDSTLTNCDARNSFRIRFYENCRLVLVPRTKFLKNNLNFTARRRSAAANWRDSRPFFSYGCALFHFPYPTSPLFATLTKTTGVCTNNSHSGTRPILFMKTPSTPLFSTGDRSEPRSLHSHLQGRPCLARDSPLGPTIVW